MRLRGELFSKFSLALFAVLAIDSAPVAAGQQTIAQSSGSDLVLPSGQIPTEIFGVPCKVEPGNKDFAPSLRCISREPTRAPSTSVSVRDSTCEMTQAQMIENSRRWMNDGTPFFNVVWERGFNPPSVPGGVGMKGFYQRSMGNRYVWGTCGGGKLTEVLVIILAPTDNEALKEEVELKVFGVRADVPPSAASKS